MSTLENWLAGTKAVIAALESPRPETTTTPEASKLFKAEPVYLEQLASFSYGTVHEVIPELWVTNDHVVSEEDVSQMETIYGPCVLRMPLQDLHFFSWKYVSEEKVREAMHAHAQSYDRPPSPTLHPNALRSAFDEVAWLATIAGFPAGSNKMNTYDFTHQLVQPHEGGPRRLGHVNRAVVGGVSGSGVYHRRNNGTYRSIGVAKAAASTRRPNGRLQHWAELCLWQEIDWLSRQDAP